MLTAIELMDGPLAGRIHELEFGSDPPDDLGIPDDDDESLVHWYLVQDGKGYFVKSERRHLKA